LASAIGGTASGGAPSVDPSAAQPEESPRAAGAGLRRAARLRELRPDGAGSQHGRWKDALILVKPPDYGALRRKSPLVV